MHNTFAQDRCIAHIITYVVEDNPYVRYTLCFLASLVSPAVPPRKIAAHPETESLQ